MSVEMYATTLISIVALVISLGTLLLTRRKQQNEERTSHAKQIVEIKKPLGDMVRLHEDLAIEMERLLSFCQTLPKKQAESLCAATCKLMSGNSEFLTETKEFYKKLGVRETKTKDPVVLSTVAVNIEDRVKAMELMKTSIISIADEVKKISSMEASETNNTNQLSQRTNR